MLGRPIGGKHVKPRPKLTEQEMDMIRELVDSGMNYKNISENTGISRSTIGKLMQGRLYKKTPNT